MQQKNHEDALNPPKEMVLFFRRKCQPCWVSLMLRPVVCPAVEGVLRKSMEIRFFAPGGCVANLDFVEIFSVTREILLAENDAGWTLNTWTGHTRCVIFHLAGTPKQILNLHLRRTHERGNS